jgi:NAD(P)-dependent dehydrogenase (short-subunit alcohol dehydrogenase family)
VNLSRDLAIELAPDIRVNCVCPGAVDTEMLQELGRSLGQGDVQAGYAILTQNRPMKRVARPAEIAGAILWLASDLASFTTGAIQVVDGGVMAKAG